MNPIPQNLLLVFETSLLAVHTRLSFYTKNIPIPSYSVSVFPISISIKILLRKT